jgi:ABC-type multidrug transport system fused ATPase/permease subunit
MRPLKPLKNTRVFRVWRLLPVRDQKKIALITCIQILSGLLDLLGVFLIGVIGAVAVGGFGTQQNGSKIDTLLRFLNLDEATLQMQVGILGCLATIVLVVKTGFSVYFTRRILNFLSFKSSQISASAIRTTLKLSILEIQSKPQQEILFSLTSGPSVLMVGILGTSVSLIADMSLLLLLGIALLVVEPVVATFSIAIFLGLGMAMYLILHKRASYLGKKATELNIASDSQIIEVLLSYRFLTVRGKKDFLSQRIERIRTELGAVSGENAFMPYISKYVFETAVVLGSLILAASQFLMQNATQAVTTLSIFLAAGSRIAPAALRIQQGALLIKNNLGVCEPALLFLEKLPPDNVNTQYRSDDKPRFDYPGYLPTFKVSNVCFQYPGSVSRAISDVSFEISEGSVTSIVGESGSGKSTLADLLLGILIPDQGEILLSGKQVQESIELWPGATAYVPQEVALIHGTIRDNVTLGFESDHTSDSDIFQALELAQLGDFARSLPQGIDTMIGERGTRLSGGQRQRLGIARALFTKPKLIILDEATSSLDGSTEADISEAIQKLRGSVTVVIIAHRLSTVKESDQLLYLSEGKLVSQGSFDHIRGQVSDFDKQASLMGL